MIGCSGIIGNSICYYLLANKLLNRRALEPASSIISTFFGEIYIPTDILDIILPCLLFFVNDLSR